MYTTPTTAIVAVGTVTPVAGVLIGSTGATGTETVVNAAPVAGPGLAEVAGSTITNEPELVEVLGVKFTNGANPVVDALQGAASGSLPMTGANLLFLTLSAITIILIGLTMVRIGRNLATAKA